MLNISLGITIYICVIAAILGACMGSFLNCMAWRIVHGESVLKGRSHCDFCGHVLGIKDLFPVVSFLAHGGKCPYCKAKLSSTHVIYELISAVCFVLAVLKFDISWDLLKFLLIICILLVCAFTDIEDYLIPDRFIIAGAAIGIIFIFVQGDIGSNAINAAIGGIAIPLVLTIIVLLFEKIRGKEAMGGGDIKLLFVTGLALGWQRNILVLLFACIIGIIFAIVMPGREIEDEDAEKADTEKTDSEDSEPSEGKLTRAFPWGPSIGIAAFIVMMVGDKIIAWYTSLF